jgi:EpsI family protein
MQNSKVLGIIGLALVLTSLVANHAIGRLKFARPKVLPVETFPTQIGDWKQFGKDLSVDPEVQKVLPTAHIVERTYRNPSGQIVSLLLLTASDYKDFHDPNVCLPGHGWQLSERTAIQVEGRPINRMEAVQQNTKLLVLYWLAGDYMANVPHGLPMQKALSLRKALTGEGGQSLFVRIIATDKEAPEEVVLKFASEVQPAIQTLIDSGKSR